VKDNYGSGFSVQPLATIDTGEAPLQLSWNREGTAIFAGCCDNTAKMWDLGQNRLTNIGQHTMPVAQVHWCEMLNVLYAMSWDKTIALWDGKQPQPAMSLTLDKKVDRPLYC
jgi:mRNA export factor